MFQSEVQRLQLMIWGVLLFLLSMSAFRYSGNGDDAYWHITVGEWILTHHQVPTSGIFSYTNADKYWTSHEWLSEVLTYAIFQYTGWAGLFFFTLLCLLSSFLLLLKFLLKRLSAVQSLIFVLFAFLLLMPHILPRPHIFALPLMLYWTICLVESCEKRSKPPFYILPLMILWVNLHGSFITGIAFSIFFAAEAIFYADKDLRIQLIKQWGIFIIATVVCAAATPHGINGLLFPLHSSRLNVVSEWQAPDFHSWQPMEIWLLSFLALLLAQGIKLPVFRLVFMLGIVHLSLKSQRHAADLLSILSPLVLATPLAGQWHSQPELSFKQLWPKTYKGISILALYFFGLFFYLGHVKAIESDYNRQIQEVLLTLKPEQQHLGNVLNGYGLGDFLIPLDYPVFIDPRGEIYSDDFIEDFLNAISLVESSKKLEDIIAKYHVTWTLFETKTPINTYLTTQPQWIKIYSDHVITIFLHKSIKLSATTLAKLKIIEKLALEKHKAELEKQKATTHDK